ncbi:MAG: alpha,alpha-trehalase TreA [Sphingobacteriales bacterium]|nr:MAG: alpha,alpha-trehalase TreA [Sphingobacteriales bacterium]
MKTITLIYFAFIPTLLFSQNKFPLTPNKIYGDLFSDIQLNQILPDGKTFVDATPKRKVKYILSDYDSKIDSNFNLTKFVQENFNLPLTPTLGYEKKEDNVTLHIKNLWPVLLRQPDKYIKNDVGNSILPLPYPYIVPGGRFREIYYWDSYFTLLGLKESGETKMIENMVKNFAYLINTYGHMPNGNRSYYLSRSQPPFFCLMVKLLASIKGEGVYKTYLPAMEKEYAYWMLGANKIKPTKAINRVVKMQSGALLNRYWDDEQTPRPESYKEDYETAEAAALELAMRIKVALPQKLKEILDERRAFTYKNLRAGACSGWDFSSRWFADNKNMNTIQTTQIIPVDLNCLLFTMEQIIAHALLTVKNNISAKSYLKNAAIRKLAINKYCYNAKSGYYFDYNFETQQQLSVITAAGLFPLFANIATTKQSIATALMAKNNLLKAGGLVTTTNNTGQQWDAPNGWAPLQWIAVKGLKNYKQNVLANAIANRWLMLNDKVYLATGKMMEKYNVEDVSKLAGGGEYPSQDGFGWTNGVYLALKTQLK